MANEIFITGYQYSPTNKRYIGEYQFPKNKNEEEIHLPPNTTLLIPPKEVPSGKCLFWRNDYWEICDNPDPQPSKPNIENYALLKPEFIDYLKSQNLWDERDEQRLIEDKKAAEEAKEKENIEYVKMTPCPAFGWVIVKTEIKAGAVLSDELFQDNKYVVTNPSPFADGAFGNAMSGYTWLYTNGKSITTNTNYATSQERNKGFCNIVTSEMIGENSVEFLEDATVFCLSPSLNQMRSPAVPHTTYFSLMQGESTTLEKETKLFLAAGSITVDGVATQGREIRLSTNQTINALEDCYGLIFP